MILFFLKTILRNIKRAKEYALFNILGMAVGLSCVVLIFLWANHELNYDNFYSNTDNLYLVGTKGKNSGSSNLSYFTPYALSKHLAEKYPNEIINYTRNENYAMFSTSMLKYVNAENSKQTLFYESDFQLGDTSFFHMFDFPFIYGNSLHAFDDPYSIVLSKETSEKYFGNINPVGKKLTYNNQHEYTVTGVVDIPSNTQLGFDVMVVNTSLRSSNKLNGWNSNGPSFIQVTENVNINDLRAKIKNFFEETEIPINKNTLDVDLLSIKEMHTQYGLKTLISILMAIALLILTIACINYISLSTALFSKRVKMFSLNRINGAKPLSLALIYILESTLVVYFALFLATILVIIYLPHFNNLTDTELSLRNFGSIHMIIFKFMFFGFLVAVLSALFPSLSIIRKKNLGDLKYASKIKGGHGRKPMVIFQFVVSIFLITSTLFIVKQRNMLLNNPLGFSKEFIVNIPINKAILDNFDGYREELLRHTGIESITAASTIPSEIFNHSGVRWGDVFENIETNMKYAIVKPDYIKTFGMKLKMGASFDFSKPVEQEAYIINQSAANRMNFKNPIGKEVEFWGRKGEIIGMIEDFENNMGFRQAGPLILSAAPIYDSNIKYVFIKINPNNIHKNIKDIENTTRQFAPDFPFEYVFLDEEINRYYQDERRFNKVFVLFTVVAIIIASMGLIGLSLFTAEKRIKEIGVRKVNGAKIKEILGLLFNDTIQCIVIGFIISCPLVYLLMKTWLQNYGYRTTLSWWIYGIGGLSMLMIALTTVGWQSWKAAKRNPVEALRYE